jgi:hypothetical protein
VTGHQRAVRLHPDRHEIGQPDYPDYWTETTHASAFSSEAAVYLACGRAAC